MRQQDCIAYSGEKFVIEWYFDDRDKSQALTYFLESSNSQKDKLLYLFKVMASTGKLRNKSKFRFEGNHIYEFKPMPDRFLCFFFAGNKIIITNAFVKKSDKLPPGEKDRALRCKDDYVQRTKKGSYYE